MRALAHAVALACALLCARDAPSAAAQSSVVSINEMLDRYPAHTADLSFLKAESDFKRFRELFIRDATAWIRVADAAARRHRELVAAAFALEIAHAGLDTDWSEVRHLIEWGSHLLRQRPQPDEGERLWHLAALPLVQGAF